MRNAAVMVRAWRQDDAGDQQQDVRPGRARKQIGEPLQPEQQALRERIRRGEEKMERCIPSVESTALNRGNRAHARQIESTISPAHRSAHWPV